MKFLYLDENKCTGCLECMYACSNNFEKKRDLNLARLWIMKAGVDRYKMKSCMSCEDAPCIKACPEHAIWKLKDRVAVKPALCKGHGDCVDACPFGVIYQHPVTNKATKCVLCGVCVKACPEDALSIVDQDILSEQKRRLYSLKIREAMKA